MSADLTHQQKMELRYGVRIGEPSNMTQIVGWPRNEGQHVRLSSRTTPTADWWVLMIRDQTGPGRHRQGTNRCRRRVVRNHAFWIVNR